MRTRTRKILSLLLATAMVFTMNTFVMAEEATVEAAENEPAIVEEVGGEVAVEGATEDGAIVEGAENVDDVIEIVDVADVEADDAVDAVNADDEDSDAVVDEGAAEEGDDAVVDEVDEFGELDDAKSDLEKDGWTLGGDNTAGLTYSNGKLTLASENEITLTGTTDSKSLEISTTYKDGDRGVVDKVKIKKGTGASNKGVTLKIVSDNKGAKAEGWNGYGWFDDTYWISDKDELVAWAKDAAGEGVTYTVDNASMSGDSGSISATFDVNIDTLKENNQPFGVKGITAGSAKVTYYENIAFPGGKGAIKNNLDTAFKMTISGGNVKYKIASITLKFDKGTTTAHVMKVKLDKSVGTKSDRKAIEKAMKSITFKCYPYNLSKGGATDKKVNKKNTKLTVKINGKKVTVKNGKTDKKYGGTPKLTVSGSKIVVSGCNILTGAI